LDNTDFETPVKNQQDLFFFPFRTY